LTPAGALVVPVSAFFADLLAAGRSEATIRSYGMDLLRWFRFTWAAGVPWNMATRAEAGAGAGYAPSVRAHSETVLRVFLFLDEVAAFAGGGVTGGAGAHPGTPGISRTTRPKGNGHEAKKRMPAQSVTGPQGA
jgi:hypothetical protein